MTPQTLNNEVLAETVPLKNLFVRTVSAKNEKNISSDLYYSRRLWHTSVQRAGHFWKISSRVELTARILKIKSSWVELELFLQKLG